jgi:nucleotide-binding universal stress UspA family protein
MTLVVPFDGSELSETALVRATAFSRVFEEPVLSLTVVPVDNVEYARERGWLSDDEPFDLETVEHRLRRQVLDINPESDVRHEQVDAYAGPGRISKRIRAIAREVDASMVFVGSENAGKVVTSLSSVGSSVATDDAYDVVIVRHPRPSRVQAVREASPTSE